MNQEELTKEMAILKQEIAELKNTRKDPLPEKSGRTFKKRIMVPLCIISAMLVSVLVFAATIPNTFTTGGVISATKFNDNFSYIVSRLWELSGSDLYYTAGNVGIGTMSPGEKLEVNGNLIVTGTIKGEAGLKIGAPIIGGFGFFLAGANDHHANRFVAPSNAIVSRLWINFQAMTIGSKVTLGIYSDSSGVPGSKLGQTSEYIITANDAYQDKSFSLESPISLTAGEYYWLTIHSDTNINVEIFGPPSPSSNRYVYRTTAYSSILPDPFGTITGASGSFMAIAGY